MPVTRDAILDTPARLSLPDGGDLVSRDTVRALSIHGARLEHRGGLRPAGRPVALGEGPAAWPGGLRARHARHAFGLE